jgi:hypothetical protein
MKNKLEQNIKKRQQFRLRGKKLFLTYSQLNVKKTDLENIKELILINLEKKLPKISQYIIAEEKHQDGGLHYHVYLELNQRVELFGANCLDIEIENQIYHGKYETIRKRDAAVKYIVKTGDFIAKSELPFLDGELYLDFKEYLTKLHEKGGLKEVKNHLIKNPLVLVKGGSHVLKNLEQIDKLKFEQLIEEKEKESIIPISSFNVPSELFEWFNSGCVETLIINGLSGMGKTEMIKSFLESKNICFLLIRNVHGLRDYDAAKHKAVIFDDVYFEKELSSEEHLGMADTANPSNIRILRDSVRIMQNTMRIFTTNNVIQLLKNNHNNKAVLSKYLIINIDKSLFKENIQVDVHIKIRNKTREEEVYKHNMKVLEKLKYNNIHDIPQPQITS